MPDDESAAALLGRIDDERRRLQALLAGKDEAFLAQRPPSGKWSVLENVRHLLFAEHAHLGRLVRSGVRFKTPGLPGEDVQQVKRMRMAGTDATTLEEVLAGWDGLHESAAALAGQDTEDVRRALSRNLRHLRAHTGVIERLLRAHPG